MESIPIIVAILLLTTLVPAHADSLTYCTDNNTLVINETFKICGSSPVLNPSNANCVNYTRLRVEVCAAGCDSRFNQCTPLGYERIWIIMFFILLVIVLIYVVRRYVG